MLQSYGQYETIYLDISFEKYFNNYLENDFKNDYFLIFIFYGYAVY